MLGDIFGRSTCWPCVFSMYTEHFDGLSDKERRISPSLTCPLFMLCYFSFLSTTWFTEPLLTGVPSNPLITVYWREVTAWISRNAGQFGILFGVVLSRFFRVPGSLFIWTFHVQRNERQTVGFKDVYWIHYYHLPNIIFLCSSVHYLYPSTFSLGRFVSS